MAISHALASGMGGVRTTGDLVARMQMSRGMKIDEAKAYVANRLGASVSDLANEDAITELRREHDMGLSYYPSGYSKGLQAKANIAHVLGIDINCVKR